MKKRFIELLLGTGIVGIENLIIELENGTFFESPASSGNHLCKIGGLLEHSLNVYDVASKLPMAEEVEPNDLIIACLLHDAGKMGAFGKANYVPNILKSTQKVSEKKPFKTNNIGLQHQDISLMIINKHIALTQEAAIAIKYHNGLYTSDGRDIKGNETKLMLIVHFADMWASRAVEV